MAHGTTPQLQTALSHTDLVVKAYRAMLISRALESKLSSLYKAGKIVGGVYLGTGQEAISSSLGIFLKKGRDIFNPLIRDQAGRIAFGEQIFGRWDLCW